MAFDIDEALQCFQEFSTFMAAHDEPRWAGHMNQARVDLMQVEDHYDRAVKVFLQDVDRMWGGPMGGGLSEFSHDTKWSQGPPDALNRFYMLWDRLSILRTAAEAYAKEQEAEHPDSMNDEDREPE